MNPEISALLNELLRQEKETFIQHLTQNSNHQRLVGKPSLSMSDKIELGKLEPQEKNNLKKEYMKTKIEMDKNQAAPEPESPKSPGKGPKM